MSPLRKWLPVAAVALLLVAGPAGSQTPPQRFEPSLEPVAETKLLMEGLAKANYRGLEQLLRQKPASDQAWQFARGQAMLIAETGNLLMLRPPKQSAAQDTWFQKATQLRDTARVLGQAAVQKDYVAARRLLVETANVCNGCHTTFRVSVEIVPFADAGQ